MRRVTVVLDEPYPDAAHGGDDPVVPAPRDGDPADSGGPGFRDGPTVAVTGSGHTNHRRHIGGYQRVDIAISQDRIATC